MNFQSCSRMVESQSFRLTIHNRVCHRIQRAYEMNVSTTERFKIFFFFCRDKQYICVCEYHYACCFTWVLITIVWFLPKSVSLHTHLFWFIKVLSFCSRFFLYNLRLVYMEMLSRFKCVVWNLTSVTQSYIHIHTHTRACEAHTYSKLKWIDVIIRYAKEKHSGNTQLMCALGLLYLLRAFFSFLFSFLFFFYVLRVYFIQTRCYIEHHNKTIRSFKTYKKYITLVQHYNWSKQVSFIFFMHNELVLDLRLVRPCQPEKKKKTNNI